MIPVSFLSSHINSKEMSLAEICIKSLKSDKWLSSMLGKPAYRLDLKEVGVARQGWEGLETELKDKLGSAPAFIYAKTASSDLRHARLLERAGFHLADTSVTFEKPLVDKDMPAAGGFTIRFAEEKDRQGVMRVAEKSFTYSRFHMDPLIPRKTADRIKSEWAGNYFSGNRGDEMVVGEEKGRIAGFVQIINSQETLVIDLIAVDRDFRRCGLAAGMIRFIERGNPESRHILVGTQAANTASMSLYETLGFRIKETGYVFHCHWETRT